MPIKTEWDVREELKSGAARLSPEQLPDFLQAVAQTYQGTFWHRDVVGALVHNMRLPLESLISSKTSAGLYKSILANLEDVVAPIDASHETRDISQFFLLIVRDPLFGTIDDAQFRNLVSAVTKNSALQDLSVVRKAILLHCVPGRYALLSSAFLDRAYQDFFEEVEAKKVLSNLVKAHVYPFLDRYRFFVRMLAMSGEQGMHQFLLNDFSQYIVSPFQREALLLQLAEIAPYDFPVFFYKRHAQLTRGLQGKYSQELKQARRLCWERLSFMQKLFSMVPFLL